METKKRLVYGVGNEMFEYVLSLKFDQLPSEVVHQAKRAVLDSISTMLAGIRTLNSGWFLPLCREAASVAEGECTIIGTNYKTTCQTAAYINASHAQVHDFNDGINNSGVLGGSYHPGRVLIPSLLAVAEKMHSSGRELLCAIVTGYDVAVRVRNPGYRGIPIPDAYASAAASAKLMGATKEQLKNAVGIAGALCPCKNGNCWHYDTDFLANGAIAQAGVMGALLAMNGMTGPEMNDNRNFSKRFYIAGMGKEYSIMNYYFKPYPTCRMTHSAIEMALKIHNEKGISPEEISEVIVYLNYESMYVNTHVDKNSSYRVCEFNIHYPVACALIDGNVDLSKFTKENIARDDIQQMVRKIKVVPDESLDGYSHICHGHSAMDIVLTNGEVINMYLQYPLGSAVNPMTDEQMMEKLEMCAGDMLSSVQKEEILNWIWNLDQCDNITIPLI